MADTPASPLTGLPPLQSVAARPFFLLAALLACLWIPLSLAFYFGKIISPGPWSPVQWHSHEMIYGYALAVIAGFLLTSARVWTGRETVYGAKLLAVVALWILGRLAVLIGEPWPIVAILDVAFLPVVAVIILVPIVASANWRNIGFVPLLLALSVINALWHLTPHMPVLINWLPVLVQLSIDGVVLVILIVGGRIIPAFTGNAIGRELVRPSAWWDMVALLLVGTSMLVHAFMPASGPAAMLIMAGGIATLLRLNGWGASKTLGKPILWVLHLGWVCIGLGLVARGTAILVPTVITPSLATHLLTVGGIGVLTLGMMSRVALGHTGRPLILPTSAVIAIVLLIFALLARVGMPLLFPSWYVSGLLTAASLWAAAFALYLFGYFGILTQPRVDGRPG